MPLEDRHGLAAQEGAVAGHAHADDATTGGGLETEELGLSEPAAPEGAQAAVGRPGHRVLVDADDRGEEPRDEVERGLIATLVTITPLMAVSAARRV